MLNNLQILWSFYAYDHCKDNNQFTQFSFLFIQNRFSFVISTSYIVPSTKIAQIILQVSNFNYSEYFINTILPNQEPVIIGSGNVSREAILGSGNFGKVYKGTWSRNTHDGKAVSALDIFESFFFIFLYIIYSLSPKQHNQMIICQLSNTVNSYFILNMLHMLHSLFDLYSMVYFTI